LSDTIRGVYHPTTRVLAVLELLQTHGQMAGSDLAARLKVNGRTLRRYIARLLDLGIPIAVEHGRHGGYRLVPGYKLPPLLFTDEEALALSVGLLAARSLGLADANPGVVGAQAKLERVMPASLRRRVRAADETVALDLPRRPTPPDGAALAALTSAAQARRRVVLDYVSAQSAATAREFDPYGLAYRGGCWYAVGHCHLRKGLRSFRVDRIRGVRALDVPFERPASFDALAHVAFSVATIPRRHAVEVFLKTGIDTARRELFPTIGVLEPAEGGVLLRAQADDLAWFARELARLPFAFEVRRPRELRTAVRAHAKTLLATGLRAGTGERPRGTRPAPRGGRSGRSSRRRGTARPGSRPRSRGPSPAVQRPWPRPGPASAR
jgi:predicted DNA-binding transcriptional regulator YafY